MGTLARQIATTGVVGEVTVRGVVREVTARGSCGGDHCKGELWGRSL